MEEVRTQELSRSFSEPISAKWLFYADEAPCCRSVFLMFSLFFFSASFFLSLVFSLLLFCPSFPPFFFSPFPPLLLFILLSLIFFFPSFPPVPPCFVQYLCFSLSYVSLLLLYYPSTRLDSGIYLVATAGFVAYRNGAPVMILLFIFAWCSRNPLTLALEFVSTLYLSTLASSC